MESWQQRVIDEEKELSIKIKKLDSFVTTDSFENLSSLNKELLVIQLFAMKHYDAILNKRISNFNKV